MKLRWLGGLCAALVGLTATSSALASSGIDSPENGVLQLGRGGAWVARADEPLAAYYNPAGLARQSSGVHVGVHLMLMNRCYTRLGADGQPVRPTPSALFPGPGEQFGPAAEVCAEIPPFPNPGLSATFRVTPQLAFGVNIGGPHGVGHAVWPEALSYKNKFGADVSQPAPQRYMLISSDATILFSTFSASYAINDKLSIGAGFIWGLASVEFVNFTEGVSPPTPMGEVATDDFKGHQDIKATLTAKDLFIPGFVLGGIWSATPNLDVGAWVKWTDAVKSKASLHAEANYWTDAGVKRDTVPANVTDAEEAGDLLFRLPMEAKLGVRFHQPRPGATSPAWASRADRPVRDALSQDLFDAELDFTYAHNSVLEDLELSFPAGIAINGTPGEAPADANVAHHWKDVFGVRLGGEYVVLPGRLALRAGGFFETKGQDDEYLNIDFHLGTRVGVGGGGTVRLGPVDVSLAYQHTFFGELDNKGKGALKAISGDKDNANRSRQSVNGGSLRTSLNEIGLAGTFHW